MDRLEEADGDPVVDGDSVVVTGPTLEEANWD